MLMTTRKPATIGEILTQEFIEPMGLTKGSLAQAMGVACKHVNELCNDRRTVTAPTALILARVFGNSPEFWLNVQRRSDLWEAMHSPRAQTNRARAVADRHGVIFRLFSRWGRPLSLESVLWVRPLRTSVEAPTA
jgi:addiction module HigA family antidote